MFRDMTTRHIAVFIVAAMLIVATFLTARVDVHTPRRKSAQQLWAKAVLHSFPGTDVEPDIVPQLYALAIARTESPANIYVALGDFLRGPVTFAAALNMLKDNDQVARLTRVPGIDEPGPMELQEAAEALDRAFSFLSGGDDAVAAYRAAERADPASPLPRFRLAVYAAGEIRLKAARWLSENAPDNAIGPFLEAACIVESDPSSVLTLVAEANRREMFYLYRDPVPEPERITFPGFFEEFAGRPVPQSVLQVCVHRQNTMLDFADPLNDSLQSVLDRLQEIAEDRDDPRSTTAIAAHQKSCDQIIFNSSGDFGIAISAVIRCQGTIELASEQINRDFAEYARLTETYECIERFTKLAKSKWSPRSRQIRQFGREDIMSRAANPVLLEEELVKTIQAMALDPFEQSNEELSARR